MSGAVSIGVAVSAIAFAATDLTAFTVIAAVGATVGAIGAVTHVKELQIAGAAIGAVGMIGGLASAAGVFGEGGLFAEGATASSFGASGAGELGLANAGAGTALAGADNLAGLGGASGIAPSAADNAWSAAQSGASVQWGGANNVIDNVVSSTGAVEAPAAASAPDISAARPPDVSVADGEEAPLSTGGQAGETLTPAAATGAPSAPTVTPSADVTQKVTGLVDSAATPIFDPNANVSGFGTGRGPPGPSLSNSGSSSSWGDIWNFVKDNKTLVSGVIQGGASFLSGALNPLIPSQQNAFDAQAKANQAAANRSNAEAAILQNQLTNMQQPIPVASRVTGRPTGFVNQAPQITGVPA